MVTINDTHQQFAGFFKSETLKPYAYLVSKKLAEGHICINLQEVRKELANDIHYKDYEIKRTERLADEPLVTCLNGPLQPFVLHNDKLYLQRYFSYETQVLERLQAFLQKDRQESGSWITEIQKHKALVRLMFEKPPALWSSTPGENVNWPLVAAISGALNNFTIITGGPGTGKTTTVARILAILYAINPALRVALAAPTGKAAARMAESLKSAPADVPREIHAKFETLKPTTIHRLLKFSQDSPYFRFNKDNPVHYNVVIIDETSMIDVALFAKLLNAIGPDTKLILLGDKDQLASVEAGSLFGDLCKSHASISFSDERAALINSFIPDSSEQVTNEIISGKSDHILSGHIIELKKSYRFRSDKGIGKLSKAVINGNQQQLQAFIHKDNDEQVTIDTTYDEKVFEKFINGYEAYINEPDIATALKKLNNIRVLCAVREGEHGLYAVNRKIEKYLFQKKLIKPGTEFYENRPVIVTKNYYNLNLFNGDVGIIRYDENHILKAWFEDSAGGLISILPGFIIAAETVFAMTVHKSQGSEYDQVLVVLPDADLPLLTAELLYTGITRAKSKVIVQAPEEVIEETSKRRVKRASGIIERFSEIAGA